jgi:hypothetical protein
MSAAGSSYIKSSGSGSAASSFAAPSDTAEAVTSGSKSAVILDPLQQIIVETFNISADLMQREKIVDLRVTYAKFLDIERVIAGVTAMEVARTWTHKKPTVTDIAGIYMSRSGYFNRPHKFFPKVNLLSGMQEWLENKEDAPTKEEVWGDKQPTFKNLSEMLDLHGSPDKKKKETKHKKKQKVEPSSHSEEEVVKGKGKGKAKAKKAGGGSKKKAGPSNSRD